MDVRCQNQPGPGEVRAKQTETLSMSTEHGGCQCRKRRGAGCERMRAHGNKGLRKGGGLERGRER